MVNKSEQDSIMYFTIGGIAFLLLGIGAINIIGDGWTELNTIYIAVMGFASACAVAYCIQDAAKRKLKNIQAASAQASPADQVDWALIDAAQSDDELAAIVLSHRNSYYTREAAFERTLSSKTALRQILDQEGINGLWGKNAVNRLIELGEFPAEQKELFYTAWRSTPSNQSFWDSLAQMDHEPSMLKLIDEACAPSTDKKQYPNLHGNANRALDLLREKHGSMPALAERLAAYIVRISPSMVLDLVGIEGIRWWELPQAGFSRPIAELPRNFSGGAQADARRETLLKGLYQHRPDLRGEILALDGTDFIAEQDGTYYFPEEYVYIKVLGEDVIDVTHSKQIPSMR